MLQTFWLVLTYTYNIVLVLFIATHLFVGAIISFLTGMYMGVYLTQNYEIPRINDPRLVWEKFLSFLERNRKYPEKVSVGNLLRPSTLQELMVDRDRESSSHASETNLNLDVRRSYDKTESNSGKTEAEPECQSQQAEMGEGDYENDDDINMISSENELGASGAMDVDGEADISEKTDTATLEASSLSDPIIKETPTSLILTDPEDLLLENFKSISSPQILEASLTLDKNRAISRSWSKLNF